MLGVVDHHPGHENWVTEATSTGWQLPGSTLTVRGARIAQQLAHSSLSPELEKPLGLARPGGNGASHRSHSFGGISQGALGWAAGQCPQQHPFQERMKMLLLGEEDAMEEASPAGKGTGISPAAGSKPRSSELMEGLLWFFRETLGWPHRHLKNRLENAEMGLPKYCLSKTPNVAGSEGPEL